jgi:hypothetical protein
MHESSAQSGQNPIQGNAIRAAHYGWHQGGRESYEGLCPRHATSGLGDGNQWRDPR